MILAHFFEDRDDDDDFTFFFNLAADEALAEDDVLPCFLPHMAQMRFLKAQSLQ